MFKKIMDAFKEHPVQNSLMVLLVVAVCFLGFKAVKPGKSAEVTNNNSSVVLLHGSPENYFIPEAKKTTTATTNAVKKVASTVKYDIGTLMDNFYNFSSSSVMNAKTGIITAPAGKNVSFLFKKRWR